MASELSMSNSDEPALGPLSASAATWRGLPESLAYRLYIAVFVLVLAVSAMAMLQLRNRLESLNREQLALSELEREAMRFGVIEWQSIANRRVDPDWLADLKSARDAMGVAGSQLKESATGNAALQDVLQLIPGYIGHVNQELELLSAGEFAKASQVDVELVDPAYTELERAVERASALGQGRTRRASIIYNSAIVLVFGFALGSCVLFVRWWESLRRRNMQYRHDQFVLRASEERFRSLTENAHDIIYVLSPEGRIQYVSASLEKVLGKTRQQQGALLSDSVHVEDRSLLEQTLQTAAAHPLSTMHIEFRMQNEHGHWRDMEAVLRNQLADRFVGGIVFNVRDVTARKHQEQKLQHDALHDSLTNLPNRALFLDRLSLTLRRRKPSSGEVAVFFVDLDGFKFVNDSLGHDAGDDLLVQVAERLAASIRPGDSLSRDRELSSDSTFARLGGDEFILFVEGIQNPRDAAAIAERLLHTLQLPFQVTSQSLVIGASIGIALTGDANVDAEELIRNADIAMYRAKQQGKSRCEIFDSEMHKQVLNRLQTEHDLRRALENSEFRLYFQPIYDVQAFRPIGLEALLRWQRSPKELVSPGEFIEVAEDSGLIVPIGHWVLFHACREAASWDSMDGSAPYVSINISAKQFNSIAFVDEVRSVLERTGLDPTRLTIEVTERVAMQNSERTRQTLNAIRELGVRISIDDFGSGYSSLSYLRRFPVDVLKIDREFVRHMELDSPSRAIVATIITLANSLGLEVVAEGVETKGQLQLLRELECPAAQGYLLSKPVPPSEIPELVNVSLTVPVFAGDAHLHTKSV